MSIFELLNRDSEDEPEKPEESSEWEKLEAGQAQEEEAPEAPPPPVRTTKKVVHRARTVKTPVKEAVTAEEEGAPPPEGDGNGGSVGGEGSMGAGLRTGRFRTRLDRRREALAARRREETGAPAEAESAPEEGKSKFALLTDKVKEGGKAVMPRKYLLRPALWDFSSIFSLVMNAVLVGVVILLAMKINTLQNTIGDLLGGLYDNFVRMDRSYITTTIAVDDYPIPLDFVLPVVQPQTNVTLTQDVTVRNAYVVITTDQIRINAPATVTLPAGTTLPVSLQMDVPVQTTVYMDLRVPVNIELAAANSSDPGIANLHTAFLGLQDTIGPLYCLLNPEAYDYLNMPVCDSVGLYVRHNEIAP